MIVNNIIRLDKTNYSYKKRKILKSWKYFAFFLVTFVLMNSYAIYKIYTLQNSSVLLKEKESVLDHELNKVITVNQSVTKTMYMLDYMKIGNHLSPSAYINHIKSNINNIAHYYHISSPVFFSIRAHKQNIYSNFMNFMVEIELHSNNDKHLISFADSMIKNTKGFLEVQCIEIKKSNSSVKDNEVDISLKIKLKWHVLTENSIFTKNIDNLKESEIIRVNNPSVIVEDIYRISTWSHSLMTQ